MDKIIKEIEEYVQGHYVIQHRKCNTREDIIIRNVAIALDVLDSFKTFKKTS